MLLPALQTISKTKSINHNSFTSFILLSSVRSDGLSIPLFVGLAYTPYPSTKYYTTSKCPPLAAK